LSLLTDEFQAALKAPDPGGTIEENPFVVLGLVSMMRALRWKKIYWRIRGEVQRREMMNCRLANQGDAVLLLAATLR
jgi:hypothetical protein